MSKRASAKPRAKKTCAVPGCRRSRNGAHIICRDHWFEVPADIRAVVWNEFYNAPGGAAHLAAIKEAIESVRGGKC